MGKWILAMLVLLLLAAGATAAEIRLRSSAACATSVVRLADVAEVFGEDSRLATALSDIPLCATPAAGSQRSLSQHDVRQLLALSGVEIKTVQVTGSELVTVISQGASSSFPVKRPMVAAGVRQAAFETDLQTGRKPSSRLVVKPSSEPSGDNLEPAAPPLVDRGSTVTVHARTSGVRITTSGKALEAGTVGQTVSVELADSKQRVLAVVTGPQVVEISVGASGATAAASPFKTVTDLSPNP
jgi:flagellar basal body P-ring formation chaperone FlgA